MPWENDYIYRFFVSEPSEGEFIEIYMKPVCVSTNI